MKTRSEIEAAVSAATLTTEAARRDLTQARVDYQAAESHYIDKGDKRSLERKRDCSDALERAEVLDKRAVDRLEQARIELAKIDREDALKRLEGLKTKLLSFEAELTTAAAEFVAIDRAIENQVAGLGIAVSAILATYDEAIQLAHELRLPSPEMALGPRPSRAEVALAVRRIVTHARVAEDAPRDLCVRSYLLDAPTDWKTRNASAAELADQEAGASRARAEEQALAVLNAADALAAAAAKAAPVTPPTTEGATA
jgi:hypothetical protein